MVFEKRLYNEHALVVGLLLWLILIMLSFVAEQTMEIESLNHKQSMEKAAMEHKLVLKIQETEKERDRLVEDKMSVLEAKKEDDRQLLQHYKELHRLGVDLNQFLQSEARQPQKVVRITAADKAANFHIHRS